MLKKVLGFKKDVAVEMRLDITDLWLLRWFCNFANTGQMFSVTVDSKQFYWVSYGKIEKNCPFLYLKKDAIYRRFKRMADKKILERYTLKEGGTFSMYRLGENFQKLVQ